MTDSSHIRVAIYARVSTKDKGQEVSNQTDELKRYIQSRYKAGDGWELVKEYIDVKPGDAYRAQFEQMLLDARNRHFDILLFWALDRLTREGPYKTLQYLKQLTDYGVKYRSHQESFIDNMGPFSEAIAGFFAAIAKQEKARISERVGIGLIRARGQGKRLGRPQVEYDVAKLHELLTLGKSIGQIAAELGAKKTSVARWIRKVKLGQIGHTH